MIDRGNLLFALKEKRPILRKSKHVLFREEAVKHDRTEKHVVCRDENHERPTVVWSEQVLHPRFSREGQNLILEDEITIERGNPLFALRKERPKHVFLVTARTSMWKTKQITIERRNLLFAVMQITSAQF